MSLISTPELRNQLSNSLNENWANLTGQQKECYFKVVEATERVLEEVNIDQSEDDIKRNLIEGVSNVEVAKLLIQKNLGLTDTNELEANPRLFDYYLEATGVELGKLVSNAQQSGVQLSREALEKVESLLEKGRPQRSNSLNLFGMRVSYNVILIALVVVFVVLMLYMRAQKSNTTQGFSVQIHSPGVSNGATFMHVK